MATGIEPRAYAYPARLGAPGVSSASYVRALALDNLPLGAMRRVTLGDLDVLLVHIAQGVLATTDRCPHMSAPLSIGELDGCVVQCPLQEGRFDLCTGETVQMPTTGGLDADGTYQPVWTPAGKPTKDDVPGKKAEARRLTRVRRLRYYPVRIIDGWIEIAVPD
jgi:3-phenylpropionate/trans-cinnamate dioxygenase ferredoxin component